jgi:hypothetical protein
MLHIFSMHQFTFWRDFCEAESRKKKYQDFYFLLGDDYSVQMPNILSWCVKLDKEKRETVLLQKQSVRFGTKTQNGASLQNPFRPSK